ncbi:MAG: FMN-binding glutamate synthase family protein, partial [Anaerolineae bacterium]|nr:FMN-binding glutamate synthase family protein [Anaerolineae bacterium]
RLANYIVTLRKELTRLSRACGVPHPSLVTPDHFEILDGWYSATTVDQLFHYPPEIRQPSLKDRLAIEELMLSATTLN